MGVLEVIEKRFKDNMHRHEGVIWEDIVRVFEKEPKKLGVLMMMEETGGEPDVVLLGGVLTFCDCSKESPLERRSLCYDDEALESRKKNKPENSALGLADEIGIEILNEDMYRELQDLEAFDLKTSSWIETPDDVRKLGGAIFCDRRYGRVFTYHNGADSYYGARGFRGYFKI